MREGAQKNTGQVLTLRLALIAQRLFAFAHLFLSTLRHISFFVLSAGSDVSVSRVVA